MKRGVKKAQGQIITTVMLILLVLALVVIVWTVASGFVNENVEGIDSSALTTTLTIIEASEILDDKGALLGVKVIIKRGTGEGEIKELKIAFNKEGGGNEVITIDGTGDCKIPDPLEEKVCTFLSKDYSDNDFKDIESVSVTPDLGSVSGATTTKDLGNDKAKKGAPANDDPREYFRFANNACASITIKPSEKTSNDYDTKEKCDAEILIKYFRFANNACSEVNLKLSDKTSNDYDTKEKCDAEILIKYYRREDNKCSEVNLKLSEKTSNDYDTLALCEDDPRGYFRFANNACSSITIKPSEKTSNDYDTLALCEENIVQVKTIKYNIDLGKDGDCSANVLIKYDWWKGLCISDAWGSSVAHTQDKERYITCTWTDTLASNVDITEVLIDPVNLAVYENGGLADWYLNDLKLLDNDNLGDVGTVCTTIADFPAPFSTTQGSAYNPGASNSIIIDKQGGSWYILAPGKIEVTVSYTE